MKSRGLISPRETNGFATQEHHGDSIQEAVKRRPGGPSTGCDGGHCKPTGFERMCLKGQRRKELSGVEALEHVDCI